MTNPLVKRYPRELRNNLGKYLGLFFMMAFAVAFTSGYLLAASSIEKIALEIDEKYNVEDGRYVCDFEPEDDATNSVEKLGVRVYEDFYRSVSLALPESSDAITARVYCNRTELNLPSYAQGAAPAADDEVAFDRVFMQNHNLHVGDAVRLDGKDFTVSGIVTLPDYQALFEDNSNFIFNAITFTVAQVTPGGYKTLDSSKESFNFSYVFEDSTLDLAQRTELEDDMIDALVDADVSVSEFIDAEDNSGIGYALDDVQGDQVMWTVLLFILIVIMAFVFVVLTGATIEAESSVIGTMLASGWRKAELVRHYLVLPSAIGLLGVCVGLAVGVTFLSEPMQNLYYGSYSLPPYVQTWNPRVIFITAVVPFLLLVGITLFGLLRKLRFTPLQFLRHETSWRKKTGGVHLPESLPYAVRFRARVLMRNASHFATLFFGIMFASLLLLFGTCLLPVVANYAHELRATVASPYQYVLRAPVDLTGSDADKEKYAAALRLLEDRDRIDENKDSVDAAKRLRDNDKLLDTLDRLQDNDELLDALERLQDDKELMDAMERLQDNDALMDAADRLSNEEGLLKAAQRLQSKQAIVKAAQRLQSKPKLLAAAQRLQSKGKVVAAFKRLSSQPKLVAAAERLAAQSKTVAAAQRLQKKKDVVAAAQRMQGKKAVMKAAQRLQGKQDVVDAASRVQAGKGSDADLALVAALDEQTRKDLEVLASLSKSERADLETLSTLDKQTRKDLERVSNMSKQTRKDIKLVNAASKKTRKDLETVAAADAQTKRDVKLFASASAQTRKDLETVSNMDSQTRSDISRLQKASAQTRKDLELVANADKQTRDDLELIADASKQTRDDLELIRGADKQTRDDLEYIADLDSKTRSDLELVRDMDSDLLDDLRLAGDIDEDAHVVNTQENEVAAIEQAEKYALASVDVERLWGGKYETVNVYGIQPGSAFWTDVPVTDGQPIASKGLLEKTKTEIGKAVQLIDRREGKTYEAVPKGSGSNEADIALYMTLTDFNTLFGKDADYFNAYASAQELRIDSRYVANVIVPEDMDDISSQMESSMGDIATMMMAMAIPIYLILVYLLTKTVIDRSARAVSYMKVFGYRNREVNGLYIRPITYAVLVSLIASLPAILALMTLLLKVMFMAYAGNFPLIIPSNRFVMIVVIGMLAYAIVAVLHVRRIKRVPLSLALKVTE